TELAQSQPAPALPATQPTEVVLVPPTPPEPVAPAPAPTSKGSGLFPDTGVGPGAPPSTPLPASADPLDRGIERLQAKDYPAAVAALEQARKKYIVGTLGEIGTMTPQQAQTLNASAAAYIGVAEGYLSK